MNQELIPLFSKPIFKTQLTNIEVDLTSVEWVQNYHNWISKRQDILSLDEFKKLADEVCNVVADYFYGVMSASTDVEIYITESWLNKTEAGQHHHRHWHPNSIISGVVNLSGDPSSGHLKLITSQYETIEYEVMNPNLYNSKSWSFDPTPGNMILFPSNVEHLVEAYTGNIPRISLSFNTFIKGTINKLPLTRLKI